MVKRVEKGGVMAESRESRVESRKTDGVLVRRL